MLTDSTSKSRQLLDQLGCPHGFVQVLDGLETEQHGEDDPILLDHRPPLDVLNEVAHEVLDGLRVVRDQLIEVSVLLLVVELLSVQNLLGEQGNDGDVEVLHIKTHSVLLLEHTHELRKQKLRVDDLVEESLHILVLYLVEFGFGQPIVLAHDELHLLRHDAVALQNLVDE